MAEQVTDSGVARVVVLGGSFDPIHVGHLAVAEQVAERLALKQVLFLPCGQPPHKSGRRLAAAEDRYRMALLATRDNARFAVSRLELDRPGPSYTIDTIRALKAQHGPATEVLLIVGADQILELPTWYRASEVMAEARFVTMPRPGYDLSALPERLGEYAARVQVLPLTELAISASDLRQRAARGQSLRYLTPAPVCEYILSRGLYRDPAGCRDHSPSDA